RAASDVMYGVEQVMVVVPVDRGEDEAQHVRQERRRERRECRGIRSVRHLELEHHDGDDDGDHAVAERLEAALGHAYFHQTKPAAAAGTAKMTRKIGNSSMNE